jgi:hypothetical protein
VLLANTVAMLARRAARLAVYDGARLKAGGVVGSRGVERSFACVACGSPLAPCLALLGAVRCHDCRLH